MKPINISNLNEPFYFLDFECDKNGNIYLMGTLTPEGLTIYVTDPKLRAMVVNETFRKKYNVTFIDLERALKFLIETITSNRGTLVAYSDYELEVIKKILPSFDFMRNKTYFFEVIIMIYIKYSNQISFEDIFI